MSRTKRVVHIDIAKRSHLLGQFEIVLLLALVEACVLEHQHFAGLELLRHRFHFRADTIGRHLDGNPQMARIKLPQRLAG